MEEHRRFQRVKLLRPIDGRVGVAGVQIVDVSRVGLQVRHEGTLPEKGAACIAMFEWNGTAIRLECSVAWTALHRAARSADEKTIYSTGLRIEPADEKSTSQWYRLFEAIARGHEAPSAPRPGAKSLASEFVVCELVGSEWRQRRTSVKEQPAHGFTVSASEDAVQVQRLCAAYLAADAETRKLIRSLSALSISGGTN